MASDGTRVAIVTGGAGGLGRVIAQRLRADGFRVATADLSRPDDGEGAELASWLASQRCSFSTGAAFDLSGGRAVY